MFDSLLKKKLEGLLELSTTTEGIRKASFGRILFVEREAQVQEDECSEWSH